MRMIPALLHLLTTPRPRWHTTPTATDDELLTVATAMGVTRSSAEAAAGARHRPGHGRRVPGWLRAARASRRLGCWNYVLRAVGLVLTAAGTGVVGAAVALSLTSAPAAALLGLPVGAIAAAVIAR